MADLSHWDFAEHFSGYDAAALILGLEPRESDTEQWRVNIVMDRMALHYNNRIAALEWEATDPDQRDEDDPKKLVGLESVKLAELNRLAWLYGADAPLEEWMSPFSKNRQFENQFFARYSIVGWLKAIGMKSVYQFDLRKDSTTPTTIVQSDPDISPDDLPEELYLANLAYRAVLNGYGDKSDTFKTRLIDYLQKNYADLKTEAVQRIATVANADKTAGRKKRD